jgi:peptidyl-prolyl cis-trans isomerase C
MNRFKQRLARMGRPLERSQLSKIKEKVLENLINSELLYQETLKKGVKVEENAINKQLNMLKKRFPSEAEFKKTLEKMNLSEADIKSQIKKGEAIKKFIDKQFVQNITVSNEEIKVYYDSRSDSFKQPAGIRASHILIKVEPRSDDSQKAAARKKVEEIQKKLQKGADFAALAKEFSQGPSSAKGGDLGFFKRGQMVKPFEEAAFALGQGDVSEIVETRFGYHLIKVFEKKPEKTVKYEEIKDKLQQYLKQRKVQEQMDLYVEGLKRKAKVERFLAENPP